MEKTFWNPKCVRCHSLPQNRSFVRVCWARRWERVRIFTWSTNNSTHPCTFNKFNIHKCTGKKVKESVSGSSSVLHQSCPGLSSPLCPRQSSQEDPGWQRHIRSLHVRHQKNPDNPLQTTTCLLQQQSSSSILKTQKVIMCKGGWYKSTIVS